MTVETTEPVPTSVRSFSASARNAEDPVPAGETIAYTYERTDPLTGKVIDSRVVMFDPPDINILVMLVARMEMGGDMQLAATTINFFMSMVHNEDDVRYFNRRLFDPRDDFTSSSIAETLAALVEDWGSRPTAPASDSSASPSGRGKTSKAKRHGHKSTHGPARSGSGSASSTTSSSDG